MSKLKRDHLNNKVKKLLWENGWETMASLIFLSLSLSIQNRVLESLKIMNLRSIVNEVEVTQSDENSAIQVCNAITHFLHHQSVNSSIRLAHFLLFRYLKAEKCVYTHSDRCLCEIPIYSSPLMLSSFSIFANDDYDDRTHVNNN